MSDSEEHELAGTLKVIEGSLARITASLDGLEQRITRTETAVSAHAKELAARSGLNWQHVSVLASIVVAAVLAGTAYMHQSIASANWEAKFAFLQTVCEREDKLRAELQFSEDKFASSKSAPTFLPWVLPE